MVARRETRLRGMPRFVARLNAWAAYPSSPSLQDSAGNEPLTRWAPVVRDTDGRVFTLSTLKEMLEVQPFPELVTKESTPD
jgi:hypothetical protein